MKPKQQQRIRAWVRKLRAAQHCGIHLTWDETIPAEVRDAIGIASPVVDDLIADVLREAGIEEDT